MGRYLIETHGQKFEVTAPSPEAAMSALNKLVDDYGQEEAAPTEGEALRDYIAKNGLPGQGHLAFAAKGVESLPIIGRPIMEGIQNLQGGLAEMLGIGSREDVSAFTDAAVQGAPVEAAAGELFGNVAPVAMAGIPALGGKLLGMTGNLGSRVGYGALSGGAIAGADAATDGKSPEDVVLAAILGSTLGGGLPLAGKGLQMAGASLKQAMTPAVTEGTSEGIKNVSRAMFERARTSPVQIGDDQFLPWLSQLQSEVRRRRMNPTLDPKSSAAFDELLTAADEMTQSGRVLDLGDLHIFRQIAQKAAQSGEGRDSMFGSLMIDAIDNLAASTGDDALASGISAWAQGSRAELIESAIERARLAGSGFENGLKNELRKIVNNDRLRQGFSAEELELMRDIVRGSFTGNVIAALGKLGLGGNRVAGPVIASIVGGPVGMVAATGARRASEQASENAAQRLLDTVAGGTAEPRGLEAVIQAMLAARSAPMRVGYGQAAVPMLAN